MTDKTTPIDKVRAALADSRAVFERLKHNKPSDHIYHLLYENCVAAEFELDGMVLVPVNLPDEAYETVVAKTRIGMTFGDDPIEQLVYIVHRAIITPYVKGE